MRFVLFLYVNNYDDSLAVSSASEERLRNLTLSTPRLKRAIFYQPAQARDYYTDDGASPRSALQLYFDKLEDLEFAAQDHLKKLSCSSIWEGIGDYYITYQAMYVRRYPVIDPFYISEDDGGRCAYLVHYPGKADNFNTWLNYYLDNHPQIMKRFPGIREIEIYTRVDWRDSLPWDRVNYMQRNRLIFDSVLSLEEALNSDVRHDMRADFEAFPGFTGSNIHYPMLAKEVLMNAEEGV